MLLDQFNLLLDQYMIASQWAWLLDPTRVGSPSNADQGRPSRPLPITYTDRARPVPDCLIGLNRVDRIGSGNLALCLSHSYGSYI